MAEKATVQSGIYTITNRESDKVYIGSTADLRRRQNEHKSHLRRGCHTNPHLQAAWDKYGEDAFEFGVLEYLGNPLSNPDELYLAEQFWMDIYREEGKPLYNLGLVARNPTLGIHKTKETRRRMSEAHKGRHPSEETRRKMSEWQKGVPKSEESRRRMSEAHKGKTFSESHKRNISEAMKGNQHCLGYKHTAETRRNMSEAQKGNAKGAKVFPSFIHRRSGEIIVAGTNLAAMCRERGLDKSHMACVARGVHSQHKGWVLQSKHFQPWLL